MHFTLLTLFLPALIHAAPSSTRGTLGHECTSTNTCNPTLLAWQPHVHTSSGSNDERCFCIVAYATLTGMGQGICKDKTTSKRCPLGQECVVDSKTQQGICDQSDQIAKGPYGLGEACSVPFSHETLECIKGAQCVTDKNSYAASSFCVTGSIKL
jgi:hypothetical protein